MAECFINNAEQKKCVYCSHYIEDKERVLCSWCGKANRNYKQ